jgi:hypothetical protein
MAVHHLLDFAVLAIGGILGSLLQPQLEAAVSRVVRGNDARRR